jgi:putative ABC transport system permease protein
MVSLVPIHEQMVREVRPALLVLLAFVVAVLMIACVNVANLMIARGNNRWREIAVRVALGAGRVRLTRQFVTESLCLAVAGCFLGMVIAYVGSRAMIGIAPGSIPRLDEVGFNGVVIVFAIATSILTGLLVGIVPGARLRREASLSSLNEARGNATAGFRFMGRNGMRCVLVIAEVALTIVLLVGGGLLIQSFANLIGVDRGYDPARLLTLNIELPRSRYAGFQPRKNFYDQLFRRIQDVPGVTAVAGMTGLPLSSSGIFPTISIAGVDHNVSVRWVTPDYLKTLGIRLVEGRMFTDQDPPDAILVNEAFAARFFPGNAVGRQVTAHQNRTHEIVGVIGNVRQEGLGVQIEPELHFNYKDTAFASALFANNSLSIAVRTSEDPMNVVPEIRRVLAELDGALTLAGVQTMEQLLYSSVAGPRFYAVFAGVFGVIALTLSSIGIYGLLSFSVSQRTREIGIRMALGARRDTVLQMIVSQGMKLTAIGTAAGLGGAFALTSYLRGMLFGLTPLDPFTFMLTTIVLLLTALLACYLPARRVLSIDPTTSLRQE